MVRTENKLEGGHVALLLLLLCGHRWESALEEGSTNWVKKVLTGGRKGPVFCFVCQVEGLEILVYVRNVSFVSL